jgi:hypothetical protein
VIILGENRGLDDWNYGHDGHFTAYLPEDKIDAARTILQADPPKD